MPLVPASATLLSSGKTGAPARTSTLRSTEPKLLGDACVSLGGVWWGPSLWPRSHPKDRLTAASRWGQAWPLRASQCVAAGPAHGSVACGRGGLTGSPAREHQAGPPAEVLVTRSWAGRAKGDSGPARGRREDSAEEPHFSSVLWGTHPTQREQPRTWRFQLHRDLSSGPLGPDAVTLAECPPPGALGEVGTAGAFAASVRPAGPSQQALLGGAGGVRKARDLLGGGGARRSGRPRAEACRPQQWVLEGTGAPSPAAPGCFRPAPRPHRQRLSGSPERPPYPRGPRGGLRRDTTPGPRRLDSAASGALGVDTAVPREC